MDAKDRADIQDIKQDVKALLQQGAIHNELLRTHEARSLALQQEQKNQAVRLEPIQRHVDFVNSLGKTLLAVLTGVAVYALSHYFFSS